MTKEDLNQMSRDGLITVIEKQKRYVWDGIQEVERLDKENKKLQAEVKRLHDADGKHMALEETIHRLSDENEKLINRAGDLGCYCDQLKTSSCPQCMEDD